MLKATRIVFFCLAWSNAAGATDLHAVVGPLATAAHQVMLDNWDVYKQADPRQRCELKVLRQLGWQFRPGDATKHELGAQACTVENTQDAYAKGWLTAEYKTGEIDKLLASLPKMLESEASMCGYKYRVGEAARRATRKLKANSRFCFSNTEKAPAEIWHQEPFRLTPKKGTPSEALDCFYNDSCHLECAGGRIVAQLAMLRELYGTSDFDKAISLKEISITRGYPSSRLTATPSPFFGETSTDAVLRDVTGQTMLKQGASALVGFTGYLMAQDRDKLDSPNDVGENYLITQVTPEAAEELTKNGGMGYFTKRNLRLWELKGNGHEPTAAEEKEFDEILKSPMYRGLTVYIHPFGQLTMGELVKDLLRKNPRTPYKHDDLFADDLNTGLFRRYTAFYVDKCLGKK